ncbi:MAG: hypothetical protein ACRDY0_01030, partial [Acidimicrobiales bacterium]
MIATEIPAAAPAPARSLPRWLRGPAGDPAWARPALLALLVATAGLYLWDLGASGWANSFYSAAVQAGSTSWKAFFFGSFDASNFFYWGRRGHPAHAGGGLVAPWRTGFLGLTVTPGTYVRPPWSSG